MHYAHFQYFDYLIIRYFDVFAWVSIVIKVLCNNLRIRGILLIEKTVIFTLFKKKSTLEIWNIDEICNSENIWLNTETNEKKTQRQPARSNIYLTPCKNVKERAKINDRWFETR